MPAPPALARSPSRLREGAPPPRLQSRARPRGGASGSATGPTRGSWGCDWGWPTRGFHTSGSTAGEGGGARVRVPLHQAAAEPGETQPPDSPQTLGDGGAPGALDSSVFPIPRAEGKGPSRLCAPRMEIQAIVVLNGWVCIGTHRCRGWAEGWDLGAVCGRRPPGWEPDQTLTPCVGRVSWKEQDPPGERYKQGRGRHRLPPPAHPRRLSPGQQWRRQDRRGGAALGAEAEHEARPIPARVRPRTQSGGGGGGPGSEPAGGTGVTHSSNTAPQQTGCPGRG